MEVRGKDLSERLDSTLKRRATHHAEEAGQGLEGPVHVAVLGLRLDVGDGLAGVDAELAELFQAPPGVAHEPLLKGPAVEALEDHLAHFQEENLIPGRGGHRLILCHVFEFLSR